MTFFHEKGEINEYLRLVFMFLEKGIHSVIDNLIKFNLIYQLYCKNKNEYYFKHNSF